MYKVILRTPRRKEAHDFPDRPAAVNFAVRLVRNSGSDAEVSVQDAGGVVFSHSEIARTAETVRP
jgi:hypothetical protein